MSLTEIKTVSPIGDLVGKETIKTGDTRTFSGSFGKQVTAMATETGVIVTELVPARVHNFVFGDKRTNIMSQVIVNNDLSSHTVNLGLGKGKVVFQSRK